MPARCDSVFHEAYYSAHGMLISALCVCIGDFRIIIFLRNERLLIAFLVRLICHMVLPHYCAVFKIHLFKLNSIYIYI